MRDENETTSVGRAFLRIGISSFITAAIIGVGCLGYYGLGLSSEPSALSQLESRTWNEEIKEKIQTCYIYLFFSFYICVVSASIVFFNPTLFRVFTSFPMIIIDFLVQTVMQNGKALTKLNSNGFLHAQRMVWIFYCMFVGAVSSPVFLLGIKATRMSIHLTSVMISFLVILSFVAPVGKFAGWKPSLFTPEIGIFVASVGASFFPITSTLGALFFTISFHGGLIFYPISFLCHSQEAQVQARENDYCSIAMSVPMLLDVISIFGRLAVLVPPG